jgi:antitoxin ParD1/3/4
MSSIQIELPDELKRFLEAQATSRGFETPSEYVRSLLEQDRIRNLRTELEELLLEAVRTPSSPLTDQDWEDIRRRGRAILERRRGA